MRGSVARRRRTRAAPLVPPLTLALALALGALGCRTSGGAGEFEDDAGQDEGRPPDLPAPECDPRRDDGCPEGQKCSYLVDPELGPTNRCVPLLGEKGEGESCERSGDSDDCAAHRICWATDADGAGGVCVAFCDPALQCASAAALCSVSSGGLLPLCLPRCEPLLQDCAEGWGCYPDPNQRWACDRDRSGELGAHGDPCECLNCCDPGLVCLAGALVDAEGCGDGGAAGCCGAICALDEDAAPEQQCPSVAERCKPFYEPDAVILGFEKVGTCRL